MECCWTSVTKDLEYDRRINILYFIPRKGRHAYKLWIHWEDIHLQVEADYRPEARSNVERKVEANLTAPIWPFPRTSTMCCFQCPQCPEQVSKTENKCFRIGSQLGEPGEIPTTPCFDVIKDRLLFECIRTATVATHDTACLTYVPP